MREKKKTRKPETFGVLVLNRYEDRHTGEWVSHWVARTKPVLSFEMAESLTTDLDPMGVAWKIVNQDYEEVYQSIHQTTTSVRAAPRFVLREFV